MRIVSFPPDQAYEVTDAHLMWGSSLLFTRDWGEGWAPYAISVSEAALEEEVMHRLRRFPVDGRWRFELTPPPQSVGRLTSPAVPLNLLHPYNYFHFLLEWLPGLQRLIDLDRLRPGFALVCGEQHPNFAAALRFILETADLNLSTVGLRPGQSIACDRVVTTMSSAVGLHRLDGTMMDFHLEGASIARLRDRFDPLRASGLSDARRLYVRRVGTARNLTNAAEIEQLAIEAGYLIVRPETLSFVDQVSLFASATDIVGPTGAWAANLLFARPGTRVTMLYPETTRSDRSLWWQLGQALGLDVTDVYCPITQEWEARNVHSDFAAPLEIVRAALAGDRWDA